MDGDAKIAARTAHAAGWAVELHVMSFQASGAVAVGQDAASPVWEHCPSIRCAACVQAIKPSTMLADRNRCALLCARETFAVVGHDQATR